MNKNDEYDIENFLKIVSKVAVESKIHHYGEICEEDVEILKCFTNQITKNPEGLHQIKFGISDNFEEKDLRQYIDFISEIANSSLYEINKKNIEANINETIYNLKDKDKRNKTIYKKDDSNNNLKKILSNKNLQKLVKKALKKDKLDIDNMSDIINQVEEVAKFGCIIGIGKSALSNYKKLTDKEITIEEFENRLLLDSCYEGIKNGAVAAVNIPVKIFVKQLGISNPITIPVMILVNKSVKKVIDPIFKRGEYSNLLNYIAYTNDLMKAYSGFSEMILENLYLNYDLLANAYRHREQFLKYKEFNKQIDSELLSILEDI